MFKFLHAADVHLDSPLRGLEQYDGAPVDEIRSATRRALVNLVDLAIARQVSLVLLAGDLYDGDWHDHRTGLFFAREMSRLREAGIRVVLIAGNHDAANRMTRMLRWPDNVSNLPADRAHTITLDDCGAAIHGQSFATPAVRDNLAAGYPPPISGLFNIGLLHTSADGRPGHDSYAPCSLDDLRLKGYDYWALGHVHEREVLCRDPWIGFSGNVQGRHIREQGAKGCLLVTLEHGRPPRVEFECLDVFRWEHCLIDAGSAECGYDLVSLAASEFAQRLAKADGRSMAMRVTVQGESPAHAELAAEPERWLTELRRAAFDAGEGRLWIEKLKVRTRCAEADGMPLTSDGPLGELLGFVAEVRSQSDGLARLGSELAELKRQLPSELLSGPEGLRLDEPAWLEGILEQAQSLLVGRLSARAKDP